MNNNSKRLAVMALLTASVCCAVAAAAARTVLTFTSLDTNYGLYASGDTAPVLFHILLATACIVLAAMSVLSAPSLPTDHFISSDTFTVFAAFVSAFLLAARVLMLMLDTVRGYSPSNGELFEMLFSVVSVIYLIGTALKSKKRSPILAFTSFFPVGWCAASLISIYFDTEILMTSPNKILGLVSFLAAMIYFLTEARLQTANVSHRFYLAAATVAPILLFASSVPNIICFDALRMGPSDDLMRYAVQAGFGLFIYARLVSYTRTINGINGECPESNI